MACVTVFLYYLLATFHTQYFSDFEKKYATISTQPYITLENRLNKFKTILKRKSLHTSIRNLKNRLYAKFQVDSSKIVEPFTI